MTIDYSHQVLDQDIHFPTGYYTPFEEVRLQYGDREVLYIIGQATVEASCCACGSCGYAVVPGYLLSWKNQKKEAGQIISEVEPIKDDETRRQIARIIREREGISNIKFW